MTIEELRAQLRQECVAAGSQRAWANQNGISDGYVADVLQGRREPGAKILRALSMVRVVTYQKLEACP